MKTCCDENEDELDVPRRLQIPRNNSFLHQNKVRNIKEENLSNITEILDNSIILTAERNTHQMRSPSSPQI